jgi:hypothetical protein
MLNYAAAIRCRIGQVKRFNRTESAISLCTCCGCSSSCFLCYLCELLCSLSIVAPSFGFALLPTLLWCPHSASFAAFLGFAALSAMQSGFSHAHAARLCRLLLLPLPEQEDKVPRDPQADGQSKRVCVAFGMVSTRDRISLGRKRVSPRFNASLLLSSWQIIEAIEVGSVKQIQPKLKDVRNTVLMPADS